MTSHLIPFSSPTNSETLINYFPVSFTLTNNSQKVTSLFFTIFGKISFEFFPERKTKKISQKFRGK